MGAAPAPPLSPSSARPTGASRPCCFAVEMVQVYPLEPILQMRMSRPSVFRLGLLSARLLSAGSRDEPQWVFPILLPPPHPDCALPSLRASPLSQKKEKQNKVEGHAQALLVPWAVVEPQEPSGPPITHPRRPFEPGQEFEPPS